ncbi:MAG: DsbA family protein [Pseudomonadales bacterium]|jgi:2-hydroxychromene-2-carboxylate isomerase|nr:DsbA family protein [Pseudomonadales bacterium]
MNLKTRIRSVFATHFASAEYLEKQRTKARKRREKQGNPPTVHYFHQVDDPYSHLAVQKLDLLKARYELKFQPYLVSKPEAVYQGSSAHFDKWALRDALSVATDYGTVFSPTLDTPAADAVVIANQVLAAHLDHDDFAQIALDVGTALWKAAPIGTTDNSSLPENQGESAVSEGNKKRRALGHYQGAMFYFDGEWFWGIDRIRSLEARLAQEGFDRQSGPPSVPEPKPDTIQGKNPDGILLEYFPSLRSPYTAIGHQRVLDLVKISGVSVKVRPVIPMMMRGIPAPRAKQRYIITDAAREGREHGVPLGRIVDPLGEPVRRAFALFPAANAVGRGMEFVTAYLNAAWLEGIDITTEQGLKQVTSNAGLDWQELSQPSKSDDWQAILDSNLQVLTRENLWGVPSFRVSGGNITQPYACWGQDRIWRVANEIAKRT